MSKEVQSIEARLNAEFKRLFPSDQAEPFSKTEITVVSLSDQVAVQNRTAAEPLRPHDMEVFEQRLKQ